jgi:hypothetical protein
MRIIKFNENHITKNDEISNVMVKLIRINVLLASVYYSIITFIINVGATKTWLVLFT